MGHISVQKVDKDSHVGSVETAQFGSSEFTHFPESLKQDTAVEQWSDEKRKEQCVGMSILCLWLN